MIVLGLGGGFAPVLEAQYLAPRQYMRRLDQTTQPRSPTPPNTTLPPGPVVAPPPAVPAVTVTNSPKALAEREAAKKRAIELQRKRAEGGSASAQYELGVRYLNGDGVEKNLAEARKWLTAAARQDHFWAKKKLAELEALPAAEPGAADKDSSPPMARPPELPPGPPAPPPSEKPAP